MYRSTRQYTDAFQAMMNTSARIQALDHARADRTLLAVGFQTYQLGGEPTALTIGPLAEKLKSDLDRVRVLSASEPAQLHRLDQIDSQLSEFNRQYDELAKFDWKAQPRVMQKPPQLDAAAALLDALRVELAGMMAEEFRLLTSLAGQARARADEGQLVAAIGCTLIIGWLLVVVAWGAGMVRRVDQKAAQVTAGEHALRQVNAALESRVQSRSAALAEQHNLLESILDAMSEAVIAVDADGELPINNAAAEAMFGANLKREANPLAGYELVDSDRTIPILEANSPLRRAVQGEQLDELTLCKPDRHTGALRWFESAVRRIEGRPAARRAEFVARTGHQMRTHLGAITGRADLMLLGDLSGEQRRQAESIKSSADLLSTIVDDVYDFSMLSMSKLTMQRVNFDLLPMVEEVIESIAESVRARGIELGLFIDSNLPAKLRGDPHRLKQVLYNLLTNIARYDHSAPIGASVTKQEENNSDITINFQLKSTGASIPPELRRRLYDPSITFEAPSDSEGATGLGLAVAAHLIRRMNCYSFSNRFASFRARPPRLTDGS